MPWEARVQKVFSLNELIATSENKLTIHTVKDYCRRGELHPCIYFEGNLICIHEERFQDSIDKRDPVAHIETVSWARKFKGYISASNFIDYIAYTDSNTSDVFFNIGKIIEYIPVINDFPTLQKNEYLKAFPSLIDDDIQEKRWLYEINDFKGNTFKAHEIVFHISEVEKILLHLNGSLESSLQFIDHSDKPFLTSILSKDSYSALETACLMTGDNPQALELLKENNLENYQKHYPQNAKALNLILRAIEMNSLESNNNLIDALFLKEFLVTRGYLIENFNRVNYEGKNVIYTSLMKFGNRDPRPIPTVIDFSVIEDPLSEINYLRFKVSKQKDEIEELNFLKNSLSNNNSECFESKASTDVGEYSTPALEAIKGVIIKYWVNYNPIFDVPPKQTTVMDWIEDNYPEFKGNDYVKKAIDRLCRHPTAKIGGNSKVELDSKKKTSKQ